MKQLSFDYSNALRFIDEHELTNLSDEVRLAHDHLHEKTGAGHELLGWVDLPVDYDRDEFRRIKHVAGEIADSSDVLIVIGIGGSYLGARAALEMLKHTFHNLLPRERRSAPQVFFAGHNMSGAYLCDLLDVVADREVSINVISKSGTTTEPALVFRVFQKFMEDKYGRAEAAQRIYATTDREQGSMKALADARGYKTFAIPDDIGGRYSVLTPVGLLPIAAAGIDIDAMMAGAADAYEWYANPHLMDNPSYQYAAIRNVLYRKGKVIEILANYEPSLHFFAEWWKQLFGESEGKDGKGIFPAAVDFTTELHSLGQLIQEGYRNMFETIMVTSESNRDLVIPDDVEDLDELNYVAGQTLHHVNHQAFMGTLLAHTDGDVPNLVLELPTISPYYFGVLTYFFEKACGISGHLLGVNPFDQPGVDAYKANMFALLGNPQYVERCRDLRGRLARRGEGCVSPTV